KTAGGRAHVVTLTRPRFTAPTRGVRSGWANGPAAGLPLLEPLLGNSTLEHYQPLHAAHAELLGRAGDAAGAALAYEQAIALSNNAVERAELERRLRTLR